MGDTNFSLPNSGLTVRTHPDSSQSASGHGRTPGSASSRALGASSFKTAPNSPSSPGSAHSPFGSPRGSFEPGSARSSGAASDVLELPESPSVSRSSASTPSGPRLERAQVQAQLEEGRADRSKALGKLLLTGLGTGLLVATFVTVCALCPIALIAVAPLTVFGLAFAYNQATRGVEDLNKANSLLRSCKTKLAELNGDDLTLSQADLLDDASDAGSIEPDGGSTPASPAPARGRAEANAADSPAASQPATPARQASPLKRTVSLPASLSSPRADGIGLRSGAAAQSASHGSLERRVDGILSGATELRESLAAGRREAKRLGSELRDVKAQLLQRHEAIQALAEDAGRRYAATDKQLERDFAEIEALIG